MIFLKADQYVVDRLDEISYEIIDIICKETGIKAIMADITLSLLYDFFDINKYREKAVERLIKTIEKEFKIPKDSLKYVGKFPLVTIAFKIIDCKRLLATNAPCMSFCNGQCKLKWGHKGKHKFPKRNPLYREEQAWLS